MLNRLAANWMYGGFLAGVLLLALAPLITRGWAPALVATYLCLPVYMLHQYEEHDDDRFRGFVNQHVGGGHEVLSPMAAFVINVPGVWGLIALSLVLAVRVDVGFALLAVYPMVLNALVHLLPAAALRMYNPGVVTALVLFLPLGGYALLELHRAGGDTLAMHALGFAVALGFHVAIVLWVKTRPTG